MELSTELGRSRFYIGEDLLLLFGRSTEGGVSMLLLRKQWAVCGARGKNMHNPIVGKNGACETLASARGCEAGSYLLPEQCERAGCVKGKGAVKTKKKSG